MMEHVVLPEFMKRALGGMDLDVNNAASLAEWDKKCQETFATMPSLKGVSWRGIHIPGGMSLDRASSHKVFMLKMLTPRVSRVEEFTLLFTAAEKDLEIATVADWNRINSACEEVLEEEKRSLGAMAGGGPEKNKARAKMQQLRRTVEDIKKMQDPNDPKEPVEFLVAVLGKGFSKRSAARSDYAQRIANKVLAEYNRKNAAYGEEGTCWEEMWRRRKAAEDPNWRCFLPEQFMPLGDGTPDLHQPAEMLVSTNKGEMCRYAKRKGRGHDSIDLCKARGYADHMHKKCRERNRGHTSTTSVDAKSIQGSIYKMWIAAQIVSSEAGEKFRPLLLPGSNSELGGHPHEFRQAKLTVRGTRGRMPDAKWS